MAIKNIKLNVDSTPLLALKKRLEEVNAELAKTSDIDSIKKLTQEVKSLDSTFNSLNETIEQSNDDINTSIRTISALEAQLSSLNEELASVEIGTAAYRNLEKQVISVSGELKNLELARESLDNEQFASEAKSVAGGLSDVAGGLTLIGASSGSVEEIVQAFAKVEGITRAVTGGIEAYSSGVKIINALSAKGATIQSILAAATGSAAVATGAQTTATEGAVVASNALNASLLLNPIFLLVAAIAAVVAGLTLFGDEAETAEEANDSLTESIERQTAALDRQIEKRSRAAGNVVKLLQAQGASEQAIFDAQQVQLRTEEEGRQDSLFNLQSNLRDKAEALKKAQGEGNEELEKSIKKEIDATREKYKNLRNLDGQYEQDKLIAQVEFDTNQAADEKKAAEDLRKQQIENNKKRAEDTKKYNQDRLDAARKIKDAELALLPEGREKEIQIQKESTKRAIEDLNAKYGNEKNLNKVQLEELNKQRTLLTELGKQEEKKVNDKYDKIKTDADKKDKDLIKKALNDNLDAIEKANEVVFQSTLTAQEKELQAIEDKYADSINFARENGQDETSLVDAVEAEKAEIRKKYADEKTKTDEENRKKEIDGIKAGLDQAAAAFNTFASETGSEFASAFGNIFAQASANVELFLDENAKGFDKAMAGVQAAASIAQGFLTAVADKNAEETEKQTEELDRNYTEQQVALETKLNNGLISQEEYDKQIKALDIKLNESKDKEGRKAFEQSKKLQIAQTAISGLQGAIGAYASLAPIPLVGPVLGGIAAGVVTGLTAKSISDIKKTQYNSTPIASGGGGNVGGVSASASAPASAPSFSLFGQNNDSNTFGAGQNEPNTQPANQPAIQVSVTEINAVQNKVAVQENRSTL